ncbi:YoaK family protein [Mycobacterium sp.]|uniref:YoaK family protein n=1 Tax=Mycobacterium sp. TaxID=1785 RepID=UPI003C74E276
MAAGVIASPVSDRLTVAALLLLTFATGLVDAISVLVLGHVFVANMTGNIIFLGFWFVPRAGVDLTAAIVAFVAFLVGTVVGGRLARHLGGQTRRWLATTLGMEVVVLVALSTLAGTGVLSYQANTKLILIAGLAMTFGIQNATARQFGVQELSTTVLTSTVVGIGVDSRLAGGTGEREKLRYSVIFAMCGGAVVGATLSRVAVAPVIALAAAVVAFSLLIFRFGPDRPRTDLRETS